MRRLIALFGATFLLINVFSKAYAQGDEGALAIIVPGGGTYSRPISTDSEEAQAFFSTRDSNGMGVFIFRNLSPRIRRQPGLTRTVPCRTGV